MRFSAVLGTYYFAYFAYVGAWEFTGGMSSQRLSMRRPWDSSR